MTAKTKKLLGVGLFCVAVVAVAVLVMGMPGREMSKLADELCECEDDGCRTVVYEKIESLSREYAGKERSASEVQTWDEALDKIEQCATRALAGP